MRYFIKLSYFGKPYHGWQKQPNAVTVQQTVEEALSTILRVSTTIMGAGRTDTGVHAKQMFAHFDIFDEAEALRKVNIKNLKELSHKLNRLLPASIAVHNISEVKADAHTRFDALARTYRYRITQIKNPFTTEQTYFCKYDLDLERMRQAAKILVDYTDFECFSKSNTEVNNYLCSITESYWEERENELHYMITANRFLRNMVRAIVGTFLEIGRRRHPVSWMHEVLASKDRSLAGASAPAHGLYLEKIIYPPGMIKEYGRDKG